MSIWPVDGDRFGLDATFWGAHGFTRAQAHERALKRNRVRCSFRQDDFDGAWTIRLGPLTAAAVGSALRAFLQADVAVGPQA